MKRLQPPSHTALRGELACAAQASAEARFIHRLHAVLLVSMGCSCYAVARWFGEDPRSIERWVRGYELDGSDGLREHPRSGRMSQLSAPVRQQVDQVLAQPPTACGYVHTKWSGKLLVRHLADRHELHMSERQCQRLIKALR